MLRVLVRTCDVDLHFACDMTAHFLVIIVCLQCFDAVGWAAGRASGL